MDWFTIMTAPQRELAAAEALRAQNFTVYVPTIRRAVGKRARHEALFPRYVFTMGEIPWSQCKKDHPNCIRDRAGNRMLIGPVAICGRHSPIADHEVMQIERAAALLDEEVNRAPKPSLKIGDIGIITSGPFDGKSGEIVRVGKSEAELAMRIFNAVRIVRASLTSLEAAE